MTNRNQPPRNADAVHASASEDQKYFNTISKGLGYLNKVSAKKETGKDTSYKASISALVGTADNMDYERFTLYARGEQAIRVLLTLMAYLDDESNKVLIAFTASNCRARAFVAEEGNNAGKLLTYQQGNLIFISSAKVNGQEVYRAPERETE